MEEVIIAAVIALSGVSWLVYYVYVKRRPRKWKRKFHDHYWP